MISIDDEISARLRFSVQDQTMKVPMFPLGSVVYPYTAIPIRVFEPRYQTLLDRVLATIDPSGWY